MLTPDSVREKRCVYLCIGRDEDFVGRIGADGEYGLVLSVRRGAKRADQRVGVVDIPPFQRTALARYEIGVIVRRS